MGLSSGFLVFLTEFLISWLYSSAVQSAEQQHLCWAAFTSEFLAHVRSKLKAHQAGSQLDQFHHSLVHGYFFFTAQIEVSTLNLGKVSVQPLSFFFPAGSWSQWSCRRASSCELSGGFVQTINWDVILVCRMDTKMWSQGINSAAALKGGVKHLLAEKGL